MMTSTDSSTVSSSLAVSIPNCSATHVLGSASLPLATGDLALLSTPVFTLQIGTLAFPLPKGTPFGTETKNQRAYLFAPAGLEAQGGYVRVELPPDISTETHTQFERALIAEGLLVEGDADQNGNASSGNTWLGRKVEGIKDAVAGGLAAEGGGVPAEAIEGSDDEGKGKK